MCLVICLIIGLTQTKKKYRKINTNFITFVVVKSRHCALACPREGLPQGMYLLR